MNQPPRKNGFTLVELIIVVAIIGTLATIGFPTFQRYKFKAIQNDAKIQMASAFKLVQVYNEEFGTFDSATDQAAQPTKYPLNPQAWCETHELSTGTNYCHMITYMGGGDCNRHNPFGYYVDNCEQRYYDVYYVNAVPDTAGLWAVGIRATNLHPFCPLIDQWNKNQCGRTCNAQWAKDFLSDCTVLHNACLDTEVFNCEPPTS